MSSQVKLLPHVVFGASLQSNSYLRMPPLNYGHSIAKEGNVTNHNREGYKSSIAQLTNCFSDHHPPHSPITGSFDWNMMYSLVIKWHSLMTLWTRQNGRTFNKVLYYANIVFPCCISRLANPNFSLFLSCPLLLLLVMLYNSD